MRSSIEVMAVCVCNINGLVIVTSFSGLDSLTLECRSLWSLLTHTIKKWYPMKKLIEIKPKTESSLNRPNDTQIAIGFQCQTQTVDNLCREIRDKDRLWLVGWSVNGWAECWPAMGDSPVDLVSNWRMGWVAFSAQVVVSLMAASLYLSHTHSLSLCWVAMRSTDSVLLCALSQVSDVALSRTDTSSQPTDRPVLPIPVRSQSYWFSMCTHCALSLPPNVTLNAILRLRCNARIVSVTLICNVFHCVIVSVRWD